MASIQPYIYGEDLLSIGNEDSERGLNLTLGGRLILRDVVATVRNIIRPDRQQGQIQGLLGPSGIGKTQLFRLIAGFSQPDSGRVLIGQEQLPTQEGKVGVVTQSSTIFRHKTVYQNLLTAAKQGGRNDSDAKAEVQIYLEMFNLLPMKDQWPNEISGGQRQRVAIARQVLAGHELICMDEPFSGLDVINIEKVIRLLNDITSRHEHLTILVVTHDIASAVSVADHLWLLGKEHDAAGKFIEGARIIVDYDLIEMGLAWNPDLRLTPQFQEAVAQVTKQFRTLS